MGKPPHLQILQVHHGQVKTYIYCLQTLLEGFQICNSFFLISVMLCCVCRTASGGDISPRINFHKRQRSLSQGDLGDPTDKKKLWKLYKSRETYSAILFKRGKINKSFKKRWLVLCENNHSPRSKRNSGRRKQLSFFHSQSMSFNMMEADEEDDESKEETMPHKTTLGSDITNFSLNALHSLNENGKKLKDMNMRKHDINKLNVKTNLKKGHWASFDMDGSEYTHRGYLFYFNERPIKDSDYPNGYINLSSVQCVIGLLEEEDDDSDLKQVKLSPSSPSSPSYKRGIKYLKKKGKGKGKESEYYEIILKTNDREWIFGCLDSKSYVEWLIRLKKFER